MRLYVIVAVVGTALAFSGCSKSGETDNPPGPPPPDTVPTAAYDLTQLEISPLFSPDPLTVPFQQQDNAELSGIAASISNPGILYMHNDNMNEPVIITNANGEDLGIIVLDGISTLNPEDISVGPGPVPGKSYIYFADIGDNYKLRSSIVIYRFEEPELSSVSATTEIHINNVDRLVLKYPGGPYDAETMLIDPLTRDIFVATKEGGKSTLYKAAWPQSTSEITALTPVLNTPFDLLTAGDISKDGKEILLRNKSNIWYWQRTINSSITVALEKAPEIAPYAGNEPIGEGVGFARDGSGYFTNSEVSTPAVSTKLSFYKKK
ncbi:hypothetical protein [Flavihumibacter petaseus]|uniref:Uncharacterized protein n=1 Tax=Flavihumibacter petaseus NBRC 106054 TaxID=1220578 RepID=A0A0E9MZ83_9BACT|nr:hypothetical protein [Flavihumibacter petaseus]GAO42696.1 hypothetical protein FPE01S_01_17120 [Flavihumibacter petaseus NBRC 106054]